MSVNEKDDICSGRKSLSIGSKVWRRALRDKSEDVTKAREKADRRGTHIGFIMLHNGFFTFTTVFIL
jgi:hypothetical protein